MLYSPSSSTGTLVLPKNLPIRNFITQTDNLAVLCHQHRDIIRKARPEPRRYGCLKGLKNLDPKILSDLGLTELSKENVKYACSLRKSSVIQRPTRNLQGISINELVVPVLSLNPDSQFEGFRVLHISDVHLRTDNTWMLKRLAQVANEIPNLNINAVAITGDLADGESGDICDAAVTILSRIRSQVEHAYFTLGNHDYDSGVENVVPQVQKSGFTVLVNETILLGKDSDQLQIIGLDDTYEEMKRDLGFFDKPSLTTEKHNPNLPTIVLGHTPDALCSEDFPLADIFLSGHTHGTLLNIPGAHLFLQYHASGNHPEHAGSLLYHHNKHVSGVEFYTPRTFSSVSNGLVDYARCHVGKMWPIQPAGVDIIEMRAFN